MLYVLLSDLHANLEALQAVLGDIDERYPQVDQILCLGDIVGYGADPEPVLSLTRSIMDRCIRGNHDKAVAFGENVEWFNPAARDATYWTLNQLSVDSLDFLRELPKGPDLVDSFQICHGSPLDEDEYIITATDAAIVAQKVDLGVTCFGHTHVQGGFCVLQGQATTLPRPTSDENSKTVELEETAYYLLNPGSVGQPRDQDSRAAYAVLDSDNRLFHMHRVPYEIAAAQTKILAAGLPERLAVRLSYGR